MTAYAEVVFADRLVWDQNLGYDGLSKLGEALAEDTATRPQGLGRANDESSAARPRSRDCGFF